MFTSFYWSRKWFLWAYGLGFLLFASLCFQIHIQVLLNAWYGRFYDILQKTSEHSFNEYQSSLKEFLILACWYTFFAVITLISSQFYSFAWREAIFKDYLPSWADTPTKIEGECQRLQEDTKRFASTVDSLGLLVAKAAITLVSFGPILWNLSKGVSVLVLEEIPHQWISGLVFGGGIGTLLWFMRKSGYAISRSMWSVIIEKILLWGGALGLCLFVLIHGLTIGTIIIPPLKSMEGSLVVVALFITLGGMVISWYVGHRLPGLEYNNQKVEASLRTELELAVKFNLKNEAIPQLIELFTGVRKNYYRLFINYGYFNVWANMFSQAMVVVPYLIMGPSLFAGIITLGVLTQVGNAFDKVQGSFSVLIDNWVTVNELRSIHKRLREFEKNLKQYKM
jgi:peptide/bleomycin uptake transporter